MDRRRPYAEVALRRGPVSHLVPRATPPAERERLADSVSSLRAVTFFRRCACAALNTMRYSGLTRKIMKNEGERSRSDGYGIRASRNRASDGGPGHATWWKRIRSSVHRGERLGVRQTAARLS